jgi:hypothetical protein
MRTPTAWKTRSTIARSVQADQADLDGEGVGDACDNCPLDPNPGQEDGFGEPGVGDAGECPCFSDLDASYSSRPERCKPTRTWCVDTVSAKPLTVRALGSTAIGRRHSEAGW